MTPTCLQRLAIILGCIGLQALGAFFYSALAQGYINAPVYQTGYIAVAPAASGPTNTIISAASIANHPTNLVVYPTGPITTWTITLPAPTFDSQIISVSCTAVVTTLTLVSTDGSAVTQGLTSCPTAVSQSFSVQYSSPLNAWKLIASDTASGGGGGGLAPGAAATNMGIIDVTSPSVGMVSGGTDNIQFVAALQSAIGAPSITGGGLTVLFRPIIGQNYTPYYFSDELSISRSGTWSCGGYSPPRAMFGTILVFAPGVDGFRFEDSHTSFDGGYAVSAIISNCNIYSLGQGNVGAFSSGATSVTPAMANDFASAGIVQPGWQVNDSFILATQQNGYIVTGSVSGSTLTVTSFNLGTLTVGSSFCDGPVSSKAQCNGTVHTLPGTTITACPGGGCGTTGNYTLSQAQPATVTQTSFDGFNTQWAPVVSPGAIVSSVSGVAPNQTINFTSYPTTVGSTTTANSIWRLPATKAFTITTTTGSGSNTFTVTAAPSTNNPANPVALLEPGDFVWSEAYAIGCVVQTISGVAGSQIVKLTDSSVDSSQSEPACDSVASAGSHKLWKIPSAYRPVPQTQAWNNYFRNFPFGMNQESSAGFSPAQNATVSMFVKNTSENTLYGYVNGGDNTGGSTWVGNEGINSFIADYAENGSVGSAHFGDDSGSQESSRAATPIVGNCSNGNSSSWYGDYFGIPNGLAVPFCVPNTGMLFSPTNATLNSAQVVYQPIAGIPYGMLRISQLGVANASAFGFASQNGQPGAYFTSVPSAIYTGGYLSKNGATNVGMGWNYNSAIDAWQMNTGGGALNQTSSDCLIGSAYTGYYGSVANVPYHCFMNGFLISGNGTVTGGEREVDAGTAAPSDTVNTGVSASQAFLNTSTKVAISATTGVTALYSIVDTTLSASSVIGTVSSSNSTQNWVTLTATSSINSTGAADSLLFNGTTTVAAQDPFGTTMTLIPVATCTGVTGTVTDTTQGGASVGTVSSCGTQATLIGKTAMNHASSGTGDSLNFVQRRQGDLRLNLTPVAGGFESWDVTDYLGTVRPSSPVANNTAGTDWTYPIVRSGSSANKDITGRITLAGGTATFTLAGTYTSAPDCLTQDVTTPANASSVSESTTVLTFTGTGTDIIKYVCIGRN